MAPSKIKFEPSDEKIEIIIFEYENSENRYLKIPQALIAYYITYNRFLHKNFNNIWKLRVFIMLSF